MSTAALQIAEHCAELRNRPLDWVMWAFPWDSEPSIQIVELAPEYQDRFGCQYGPDKWACEFLDQWGQELQDRDFDGQHSARPIRFATRSGRGVGKSTLSAWIILQIISCHPKSKGVVTAVTAPQLQSKTWSEVGKWWRLCITKDQFKYQASRGLMALSHLEYSESWRVEAITCKPENADSFQGQHAADSSSFFLFDEASGIDRKIFAAAEGGMTDGLSQEFMFGNPTRNTGHFFDACEGHLAPLFNQFKIDSRYVTITNKEMIQESIDTYGIDSDYVKVHVLGEFPSIGEQQFIPTSLVEDAQWRNAPPNTYRDYPLVLGIDLGRGGDCSVIYPRLGEDARSFDPWVSQEKDTMRVKDALETIWNRFCLMGKRPAQVFVDEGGLGGTFVDLLRRLRYPVIGVTFGMGKHVDPHFYTKGDQMWGRVRDDLGNHLLLPNDNTPYGAALKQQLTQRLFSHTKNGDKIALETKEAMKDRGIDSPDIADALALTRAHEVISASQDRFGAAPEVADDYDPMRIPPTNPEEPKKDLGMQKFNPWDMRNYT